MTNAPARLSPEQIGQRAVVAILRDYQPVMRKLLAPTGTTDETFVAQVSNAMRANPDLWKCEPTTVLGAALRCAQLNLAPNDGTSSAWIIPYGKVATFQLGYGGVIELARRAMPGMRIEGRPVYPNDLWSLDYGRTPPLQHTPAMARGLPRGGDAYAWYVKVTFPDGTEQVHALDRDSVEYHRSFSRQKNGDMWTKSYDAAALKSVVLDMRRWLPHTPALATAIAADGAVHDLRDMQDAGAIVHRPDTADATAELTAANPPPVEDDADDAEWIAAAQGEQP